MNKLLNMYTCQRHTASRLLSPLLVFCALAISLNCYAAPPPSANTCKTRWVLTNITPGMQFGDFSAETGSGTVTLTGGTARINGGGVDLVNAGSAVNAHRISVENSLGTAECAAFGAVIEWVVDPTTTDMINGGNSISMDNVLVDIPGVPGTPFAITSFPVSITSATVPIVMEITARMNVISQPIYGLYSSVAYEIGVLQSGASITTTGIAEAFAITPLTLTPGTAMDFGQIASGSSGGTIILSTTGSRSVGSGDADVVNAAASGAAGTFTIQGDAGLTFNIAYTDGVLTRSGGGGAPITISGFTDTATGLTLTGGADPFTVGATLTLTGSHPAGDYSTANPGGVPYSITVNYN